MSDREDEAARRWERHVAGETAPAEVRFHADSGKPGDPQIRIEVAVTISGEWVEPAMIAQTARQLADVLAARLRQAADEPVRE